LEESYKYKGLRKRLVENLKRKGIQSERVLSAIARVPRHLFFPKDFRDRAYEDIAFPISEGQTISQPFTVARQTELLRIQQGDRVLEIGTGSGYQAAILASLGAEVHSVERIEGLFRSSSELLRKLKYPVHCYWGDGSKGLPSKAPFKGIIVTAAAPHLAENLREQLEIGGRLVIPIGNSQIQKMVLLEKTVENKYKRSEHGDFSFVPLLGANGWKI
jgi:protein-L-isoaspartate(D-aspartate) O-methyltransferase